LAGTETHAVIRGRATVDGQAGVAEEANRRLTNLQREKLQSEREDLWDKA
jgi:hypothetical protein